MRTASSVPVRYGPWLVALGAALWGTESAFRIPLNRALGSDVIVFYEHVLLAVLFLPAIIARRGELRTATPRSYGYLLFSGVAGSAVGAVLFTEALRRGNPTVVNVLLNLQPVVSTTFACLLFKDRLAPGFYLWAPVAVLSGILLSVEQPGQVLSSLSTAGLSSGTVLTLLCALCWGLSTVAGRGVMVSMSLPLASGLRVVVGLASMAVILVAHGKASGGELWPAAAAAAGGTVALQLVLLSTVSGGLPLLLYFQGLKLTRASTAGYFEMMQTLAAVAITWGYFGHKLVAHQVAAGCVLIIAVALLQRAQRGVEEAEAREGR